MKQICLLVLLALCAQVHSQVLRDFDWSLLPPGHVTTSDFSNAFPPFFAQRGFVGSNSNIDRLEMADDPFGAGSGRYARIVSTQWGGAQNSVHTYHKGIRAVNNGPNTGFSESEVWIDFSFRTDNNWITHKEGKMGFALTNPNGTGAGSNPTEDFEFLFEYYSPATPKTHVQGSPWYSVNPSGTWTEQDLLMGLNVYGAIPTQWLSNGNGTIFYSEPIFMKESVSSQIRKVFHKDIDYTIRVHIKLNTPGQSDGILEAWYYDDSNGTWTKGMELLNFNWRGNSSANFEREGFNPFRGGNGGGFEVGGDASQNTGVNNSAQETWYYLKGITTYGSSPFGGATADCNVSPLTGDSPLPVNFDGSASTGDNGISSYAWDFGDGNTGSGATASHTYTTAGTYTATLTVTDGSGNTASCTSQIVVTTPGQNQPPTAVCSANPTSGTTPLTVSFDGSNSTDDSGISTYAWDFGDGSTASGSMTSHTYTSTGTFTATLTVTDADGASDVCSTTITANASSSGCNAVPSPWVSADIGTSGNVGLAGSACYDAGVPSFEIQASGANIWNTSDGFHYLYQPFTGTDVTVTVQLWDLVNIHTYAKAGIMFRETLDPGSKHLSILANQGSTSFQERSSTDGTTTGSWSGSNISHPVYLKLELSNGTITAYESMDGVSWTQRGSSTLSLGSSFFIGLAATSHNVTKLTTAEFRELTITGGCLLPDVPTLSASASSVCVGSSVNIDVGSSDQLNDATAWHLYADNCGGTAIASNSTGSFTVSPTVATTYYVRGEGGCVSGGSCSSISISVDQPISIDFSYLANSFDINGVDPVPYFPYQAGNCLTGTFSAPAGLSVDMMTGVIDLSASSLGTYDITFTPDGACVASTVQTITITGIPTGCYLPSPIQSSDIGSVGLAGEACYDVMTDIYSIDASGSDIWSTSDEFHLMYLSKSDIGNSDDVSITVKLTSLVNTDAYAKAGIMIRESMSSDAAHASIFANQTSTAFQYRSSAGASTDPASGSWLGSSMNGFPVYLKIEKVGNQIEGFESTDGQNWISRGTVQITMSSFVFGLAVCSHDNAALTTAEFEAFTYSVPSQNRTVTPDASTLEGIGLEISAAPEFSVYPNPSEGQFALMINEWPELSPKDQLKLEVVSQTGKVIRTFMLNPQLTQINLTDLTPGVYHLRVSSYHAQASKSIIIH